MLFFRAAFCSVLFLVLAVAPGLIAQTLGDIVGDVFDATGAKVRGASVTVTNMGTNATRSIVSNEYGMYAFRGLVPGEYTVRAETAGFRPVVRTLELQVQQAARVDFTLQIGNISESVQVTAQATALNTEDATVGTVIEQKRIQDLPLNGRNFLQLVSLSPNVTYGFGGGGNSNRQGGHRVTQSISIAGARSVWNNFTLDGVSNTDPNFNTFVVLPSIDMLQEFKVQTGIYPAEFGRAASQVNVSTKSGTNQYHGAVYEFVRNDKMDARNYSFSAADHDRPQNPFQWNQYGFTFGGPVRIPKVYDGTDKLFFMSNFEGFRQRTRANSVYSVPSMAMRQGDFSELLPGTQIWDPLGRSQGPNGVVAQAFAGNIIPTNRMSAEAKKLFEFWPEPNSPSESPLGQIPNRNYRRITRQPIDRDQFHMRMDWVENSSSSWFGRYSWSDEVEVADGIYLNGSKLLTVAKQYMISNTRTLSASSVNEFRFGINDFDNSVARELAGVRNVVGELNIPGLMTPDPESWGIPRMTNFSGMEQWGDDSNGPFTIHNAVFQVVDNYSFIRGKHSFRLGGEIRRDRFNQAGNEFPRGSFSFNGTSTQDPVRRAGGNSVADFYLGYPNQSEAALVGAFQQFRATSQYYYFDNVWRVRPGLNINVGLRYEYTAPFVDQAERYANIFLPNIIYGVGRVQNQSLHPVMVRSGNGDFYEDIPFRYPGVTVARDGRMGDALVKPDKNDFAPRFGVAWSPSSKWSIRTGAGMFYSAETVNSRFDMARTLGGRARVDSNPAFPTVTMANFLSSAGRDLPPAPYTWAALEDNRTSYSLQYLFNIQRELSNSMALEIGYIGSQSRRLWGLMDANEPIPAGTSSTPLSRDARTPFPEFGVIQTIDGNNRAHYNAASLKLTRRFADGLTALVGYTWSKSIDNVSAIRGQGDAQGPNQSACLSCEKAVSGFNTPHRVVGSFLYELPFGKGRKFGSSWGAVPNSVLGGWQLGSIVTVQSGRPASPGGNGGRNSLGFTLGERMNATGQDVNLPSDQRSTERWFNTEAFVLQPAGTVGNAGRNVILGPTQHLWDAAAHKSFQIVEGHTLTFRLEAFNAANHPVWANPATAWGSNTLNTTATRGAGANYGKIRATTVSMRQVQLGLKYIF